MERLCVFSGSSPGAHPDYVRTAQELGRSLAAAGVGLVYGGASVGLMGALADAALAGGGEAVGVIPQALVDREIAHPGLSELHVVGSMHERKARMSELADGFVALPGGMGTLEELFEVWVARSLGMHDKPVVVCDPTGVYEPLQELVAHLTRQGFVREYAAQALLWASSASHALDLVEDHLGREPRLRPGTEVLE